MEGVNGEGAMEPGWDVVASKCLQGKVEAARALAASVVGEGGVEGADVDSGDGPDMGAGDLCSLRAALLPRRPGRPEGLAVVGQKEVPKRGSLRSREGFSRLLHALAHIELSAVEIAAAQLFLYPGAPRWWRRETARVLLEEVSHFGMLREALASLGARYGAWPVHDALWETFLEGRSWMEHVVIVSRHQEAAGVDASAHLLAQMDEALRIDPRGCAFLSRYASLIARLHADEVGHVALGSRAWHAGEPGPEPGARGTEAFLSLVEARVRNPWGSRQPLCEPGRRAGGFTPEEIAGLKERRAAFEAGRPRVAGVATKP